MAVIKVLSIAEIQSSSRRNSIRHFRSGRTIKAELTSITSTIVVFYFPHPGQIDKNVQEEEQRTTTTTTAASEGQCKFHFQVSQCVKKQG